MDNLNFNQLLGLLSNMNKNDIEKAISQANKIMNSDKKEQIIDELKKKMK